MLLTLVENDHVALNHLENLLCEKAGITVTGAFTNGRDALTSLDKCNPEIIVTELGLPVMHGIEFIGKVRRQKPDIDIMVYTSFDDRSSIFSALKAGASGYIVKGGGPHELVDALHILYAGGAPMSPRISRKVVRELHDTAPDEQFLLTGREIDILRKLEKGMSYKGISATLHLSVHTIHTHVTRIFRKLQAKTRREALIKGRRMGII